MPCSKIVIKDSVIHDHNYADNVQPLPKTPFFGNAKEYNRIIISSRLGNSLTVNNFKTSLNSKEINLYDISSKPEGNENKRLLLLGSQILKCSDFLKSNKRQEKKITPKQLEKCSKCPRYIHVPQMRLHLEKHKRDELKKSEPKKVRQSARREAFLTCRTCNEKCESKDELHVHLSKHPPYICEKCGKGFVKIESLKAHSVTHNDPNSFLCEFCGKGFKDRSFLRSHLQVHTTHKLKCQICSKLFKHQVNVNKHIKNTHFKTYNSQCMYCGKQFIDIGRCNYHIRLVHLKVKPFECNICYKKFGRSDYLKIHKFNHTGEHRSSSKPSSKYRKTLRYKIQDNGKPVHCKICKELFKNMTNLKRHLETHVKRYSCQFCSLTFARKVLWQRHELIHEGGTVDFFRCNTCWKRFSSKESLEEHAFLHNKPRYSCDVCQKRFNRRFLLNHHKFHHINVVDEREAEKIILDNLLKVSENSDTILWLD